VSSVAAAASLRHSCGRELAAFLRPRPFRTGVELTLEAETL